MLHRRNIENNPLFKVLNKIKNASTKRKMNNELINNKRIINNSIEK